MEAVVNPRQIIAVSELLGLIFGEFLEADGASSDAGVVLLREDFSKLLIDVKDHLLLLLLAVAVLLKTGLDLLAKFIKLVVVETLVLHEFEHRCTLGVLHHIGKPKSYLHLVRS